jgi:hypothetical protein
MLMTVAAGVAGGEKQEQEDLRAYELTKLQDIRLSVATLPLVQRLQLLLTSHMHQNIWQKRLAGGVSTCFI